MSQPARAGGPNPTWLLVTGDFVRTGGMDRANFALADFLSRRGDPLHLVAFRTDEALLGRSNVFFHRVHKPLNSYTLGLPKLAKTAARVAAEFGGEKIRVVANGGNFVRAGAINWVHYVHAAYEPQIHASPLRRLIMRRQRRRDLHSEQAALESAGLIIVNSSRTAADVRASAGRDAEVIYYGNEASEFSPLSDPDRVARRRELGGDDAKPLVAFVGALGDRRKGFDILFEAWKRLRPDAMLLVIGAGAELPRWQAVAASAGLSGSVRFLGFRGDVPRIVPACDLLVAPTRYEAYGLGVHEALCCGVPAMVTRSAGVAERYPPELGDLLLSDPPTADDLEARLHRWLGVSEETRLRVRNFGERLRGFTWDDMAKAFVEKIVRAGL